MATNLQYTQNENVLTLTKQFKAPKKLVFSMFSDPQQLTKWWGPKTWPATIIDFDFTPGGIWHYYMQGPDGVRSYGLSTYGEIDAPNLITYKDAFSDENAEINADMPRSETTIRLEEQDGQTTLTCTARYQRADQVNELLEMGMIEGVTDTWNQLENLLIDAQN